MLTEQQAREITRKILSYSNCPDVSISIAERETAYVRFAGNGVTTSGFALTRSVSVAATREGRTGTAETGNFEEASLKAAAARAEELAALSPVNQEYVEPLGPQKYPEHDNWDKQTAAARSPLLIAQIRPIVEGAAAKKLVSAGFFTRTAAASAIANKRGNFGFAPSTDARLTTTIRMPDGSSSGWSGRPSVRIGEIKGGELAGIAIRKCLAWKNPVRLEPGSYTVILEPAAVAGLLPQIAPGFTARGVEEGRSFLSKPGGGARAGEKLFPEFITLRTDPFDRRYPTGRWGPGGLPARPITWIEKGVVRNLSYTRYWAAKTGKEPTPSPDRLILEGSSATLDDLIRQVDRGLLVTRFWYIRTVNPQTAQATGLTRDGLFLIEKGKISGPVMNFRFNESPFRLLQNAAAVGQAVRTVGGEGSGLIAPPILATDFHFTSVSDAV
ncbi:MAG: TldD/PmbA family protein [Acidobacteria bacterium]|nr:TldD/PmbA family protein [Acidobacteriota bacterium]